jgi:hypothetical protein
MIDVVYWSFSHTIVSAKLQKSLTVIVLSQTKDNKVKCQSRSGGPPHYMSISILTNRSPIPTRMARQREKSSLGPRVRACRSPHVLRRFAMSSMVHAWGLCSRSPDYQARLGESRVLLFRVGWLCCRLESADRWECYSMESADEGWQPRKAD